MKSSIFILSMATTLLLAGNAQHGHKTTVFPEDTPSSDTSVQTRTSTVTQTFIGSSVLNDEQKHTLAYMWNEEKLAKDVYLAIYAVNPHTTLYNIATRAETVHQATVQSLVEAYDLNITNLVDYTTSYSEEELNSMDPGVFAIDEIQSLYDTLYLKGIQSTQDALEVGCMVEVTDINDLDHDIEIVQGADDIVSAFENLRDGSYSHYWAFDNALKAMGISDGCCTIGDDFCKTTDEYPQDIKGNSTHSVNKPDTNLINTSTNTTQTSSKQSKNSKTDKNSKSQKKGTH